MVAVKDFFFTTHSPPPSITFPYSAVVGVVCRMLKKAVQRGRSEGMAEAYVDVLSDVRTKLAVFSVSC